MIKLIVNLIAVLWACSVWAFPPAVMQMCGPVVGDTGSCTGGTDGAVGSSDVNSNSTEIVSDIVVWTPYIPTEDGEVTYCHAQADWSSNSANLAIWSSAGVIQVDGVAAVSLGNDVDYQVNIELDEAFCLESGVTYWVGMAASGADTSWKVNVQYDEGSNVYSDTSSPTSGDTLGNISSDGIQTADSRMTIWCDNSATGF